MTSAGVADAQDRLGRLGLRRSLVTGTSAPVRIQGPPPRVRSVTSLRAGAAGRLHDSGPPDALPMRS